ncbi:DUF6972 family protein [Nostoc sp.]|uniref:DUF6972 family protein n=1 Tax=Nostoc sp. TaxID=1180 RepID=UPI003FA59429
MNRVTQAIIENGQFTGMIRGYDRYEMFFNEPIGYRISPDGSRILLYYGEIKINADDQYHVIPRTRPSEEKLGIYRSMERPNVIPSIYSFLAL